MLGGLRIRTKLLLVVLVPLGALVVMMVAAFVVLREARVGGPRYENITQSKDLVAEVLPPPAFIIEPYLTVQQIADASGSEITRLTVRLSDQQADYEASIEKWRLEEPDPAIRAQLLEGAHNPAEEFFVVVEEEFLPAIQRRDAEAANVLVTGKLQALFESHRLAITEVVELALAREEAVESSTTSFANRSALGLAALFAAVLAVGIALGLIVARSIVRPVRALHRVATEDLPAAIEALKTTDIESGANISIPQIELDTKDELGDAAIAFNEVVGTAVGLAADQAKLRQHTADLMINLGKRNQVLLGSQLELLDQMEGTVQEPNLLGGLFELDHLATRMRRNAESLLVLAGSRRSRSWSKPVTLSEVIQGAVSELSDYRRVDVVVPAADDIPVSGQHTVDVSHLLAEVIENALQFSPPSTQVTVRTQRSRAGVRVWISDLGVGMTEPELVVANERVSRPPNIDELNADQVGFLVIARLSLRLGSRVRLQPNPAGGLAANVDLPRSVFVQDEADDSMPTASSRQASAGDDTTQDRERAQRDTRGTDPSMPLPQSTPSPATRSSLRSPDSVPDRALDSVPSRAPDSVAGRARDRDLGRPPDAVSQSETRQSSGSQPVRSAPQPSRQDSNAATSGGQASRSARPGSAPAPAATAASGLPRRNPAGSAAAERPGPGVGSPSAVRQDDTSASRPRGESGRRSAEVAEGDSAPLPRRVGRNAQPAAPAAATSFDLFGGTPVPSAQPGRGLGGFASGVRQVRQSAEDQEDEVGE